MSITLLDGGMGQELILRSGVTTSLWSVQSLIDNPQLVGEVHRDYFEAGAEIATTNTYSVLPDRLVHHGLLDRFDELHHLACTLAVTARDKHGSGQVAGSLGPLGFSYRPDLCPPPEEAVEIYDQACKIQNDYVDLFIAETMSSLVQARGALMAMSAYNKPVWVAFSVDDNDGSKLRSGEPVAQIAGLVEEFQPAAVLINCAIPEAVTKAVALLKNINAAVGAYANGFTGIVDTFDKVGATVDVLEKREDLDPAAYALFAEQWAANGASIIGGCCEVGPEHIRTLASRLK